MHGLPILAQTLALTGVVVSVSFSLVAVWLTRRLLIRSSSDFSPPVTVFQPIRGLDRDLPENLRSFCRQDYSRYQILLGIADPDDPALPVAHQIRNEFPLIDIVIVTGAPSLGANGKISNLAHMVQEAKYDLWVVSDSDVRVSPDWLRQIVAPFADEKVGLTSCFYRMANPQNPSAAVEAFQINVDLLGGILIAHRLFRLPFALGATMAMRREAVEKIGNFEAVADYLADDYQLGYKISRVGYRVGIANHVVDIFQAPASWHEMWEHQLRWARTFRVCSPLGYFFGIFSNGLLWGTVFLVMSPLIGSVVFVFLLFVRLASAQVIYSRLTEQKRVWKYLWLAPLRDFLNVVFWVAAYAGNTVRWRGKTFRLTRDGKMKEL